MSALGLGIKRKLDQAVAQGTMTPDVEEDILHDHSEDPVEMTESLGTSFELSGKNMVEAEEGEGKDFFVPDNPLLKTTMAGKEEDETREEQSVELFD